MYEQVREFYTSKGFGGRMGFGERPALVVIDMARSWLDESSPLGSSNLEPVMANILQVLATARNAAVPVFFTTMVYNPGEHEGPRGKKLLHTSRDGALDRDSGLSELDPRLERRKSEILIEKQFASAFFATPFLTYLNTYKVDTLIITGCSTSGCIRATAESANNYNLHTIVAQEAVGDRHPLAHECNLTDIDMRYGDVVPVPEVLEYLTARKH